MWKKEGRKNYKKKAWTRARERCQHIRQESEKNKRDNINKVIEQTEIIMRKNRKKIY